MGKLKQLVITHKRILFPVSLGLLTASFFVPLTVKVNRADNHMISLSRQNLAAKKDFIDDYKIRLDQIPRCNAPPDQEACKKEIASIKSTLDSEFETAQIKHSKREVEHTPILEWFKCLGMVALSAVCGFLLALCMRQNIQKVTNDLVEYTGRNIREVTRELAESLGMLSHVSFPKGPPN